MNILGLFHAVSPETVQKMDSDLKESQAACERQHTTLVLLGHDLKQLGADKDDLTRQLGESIMEAATKDQRLTESIKYGIGLQQRVSDATRRAGEAILQGAELRQQLDARDIEFDVYVRKIGTLKGQITKLKKRLANV